MIIRIFTILLVLLSGITQAYTVEALEDVNIRDTKIDESGNQNEQLKEFVDTFGVGAFFFVPSGETGKDGILEAFTVIAFQIKNFIFVIAVIFLAIGIIKLLFSADEEESVKKWKSNIIWVSVGIFVMQIAFSVWNALIITNLEQGVDSGLGWTIWLRVFAPIVGILQLLASFAFLLMVVYAFYIIVGGAGDEEKLKKGRRTIIYGLIGFFLMRLPEPIIKALYGSPECAESSLLTVGSCELSNQEISGAVEIIGKVITYFNGFLMLVCVILVIYAGWLVLISAGEEEKLKKAKSTILYVGVGLIVLIASHAIFRFFILQG